ncbi:hypothetical protein D1872_218240 [compost metagenome]
MTRQTVLWYSSYFYPQLVERFQYPIVKYNYVARVFLQFSFSKLMCNRQFFLFSRCSRFGSISRISRCSSIIGSVSGAVTSFFIRPTRRKYNYKNDSHEQHGDFFIHLNPPHKIILIKIDCDSITANFFNRNVHIINFPKHTGFHNFLHSSFFHHDSVFESDDVIGIT